VLRGLVILNFVYGFSLLGLLIASLVAEPLIFAALEVKPAPDNGRVIMGMRLIMIVALVAVPIAHLILRRLLTMIDTVRAGDPFVIENATRLQTIAWSVLGIELLHLIIGAIAANSGSSVQPLDIDWSFSFTPWIAVLLLFVLSRVFDHGARMRADLEGTV
jgi:hypothetical protein